MRSLRFLTLSEKLWLLGIIEVGLISLLSKDCVAQRQWHRKAHGLHSSQSLAASSPSTRPAIGTG